MSIARQVEFAFGMEIQALITEFTIRKLLAGADRMSELAIIPLATRRVKFAAIG